jgi:dihydrofolate reductase
MRKVTFGVASSLDNFIARKDHAVDWLVWDDEVAAISGEFWQTIDTVIMGRKTYEVMLASGTTAYPGVKNYVFSRTLQKRSDEAVDIHSEDAAEFVRTLKQQQGKGICVIGGGELAKALFKAGLIDEIGLNIQPVLLGSGIPLFYEMSRQIDLQLLECRPLKNGGVYVLYQVQRTEPAQI